MAGQAQQHRGVDLHVGVDEADVRRRHLAQPGVARAGRPQVDRQREDLGPVPRRDGRDRGGVVRGVVDDQQPHPGQRGEGPVELLGPVADRHHDGELRGRDAHPVEDGVGQVGPQQPPRQLLRRGVAHHQPVAVQRRPGPLREPQRAERGAAEQGATTLDPAYVGPHPHLEAAGEPVVRERCGRGRAHPPNPPSALTTLPFSTAPCGEQQNASVAATSAGSRARRSSWWAARSSVVAS